MKSQTGLTVTASRANNAPVFTVQPSGTVSFTQGNAGTQDVNFTATDPNNDPITFSLVGIPPTGITSQFFTGFVRFSYTSGGTVGSSNLKIAADDGQGNVTQSTQFTVSLVASQPSWSGTPVVSFLAGETGKTVSILPYLVNYNAATDVITVTSGTVPTWCPFTGTGFGPSNGTQGTSDGSGALRLAVSRSGGTPVQSPFFSITVTAVFAPPPVGSIYTDFGDSWNSVTGTHFNPSHLILWENPAGFGDWWDANQVAQGSTAYQTFTLSSVGQIVTFSGTPMKNLAQRWVVRNTGAMIRGLSGGTTYISSRVGTNPPTLSIVAGGITYNCPCRAATYFNPPQGGTYTRNFPSIYVPEIPIQTGFSTLIQFDLSAVPASATVTSATMTIRATQVPGSPGDAGLFEIRTPRIVITPTTDAGVAPEPEATGIASAYPWDAGISANPNVIFAGDFSPGFAQKWIQYETGAQPDSFYYTYSFDNRWPGKPGAVPNVHDEYQENPPIVGPDPAFGGTYSFTAHYLTEANTTKGDQYGSIPGTRNHLQMLHMFSLYPSQPDLDKLYLRICMINRGDPVFNQANKAGIAVDWRGAWQKTSGEWQPRAGNGRVQGNGTWMPNDFHMKQSYPIGTTSATVAGCPRNGKYLLLLQNDGWFVWANDAGKGGYFDIGGPVSPVGHRAHATQVSSFSAADADSNGEIHLIEIEHWNPTAGAWQAGSGAAWTSSTIVPHELSYHTNDSDLARLKSNPANFRGGVPGFFAGGSARFSNLAAYASNFEMFTVTDGSGNIDITGGTVKVRNCYPNVARLLRAGDIFFLHRTLDAATLDKPYTYNGPDITSDSSGRFSFALANCTPNTLWTTNPGSAQFDCSVVYQRAVLTDPNPLRQHLAIDSYVYDTDMLGAQGSGWGYPIGNKTAGFPILKQDQFYSVEIGIELNSVNTSVVDAYGNGTGDRNGRMIVEIDGVRFMDKQDLVFRHHPAMKIQAGWHDTTLGGSLYPRACFPMGVTEGLYVAAKSRIGPVKKPVDPLPTYISQMSGGQVRAISSNNLMDVNPAVLLPPNSPGWDPSGTYAVPQYVWRSEKYNSKAEVWTSTCYAPNVGTYGSIFIWGGGGEGYHGTEVNRFSFDPQGASGLGKWVIPNMSEPTYQMTPPTRGPQWGQGQDPLYSNVIYPVGHALHDVAEHGDIATTGAPATGQNYDSIVFLPPPWGAPVTGSFVSVCQWANYGIDPCSWAHMFDLNQNSNGKWKRITTTGHKDQNGNSHVPGSEPSCCLDTKRHVIWFWDGQTGDNRSWISYIDLNTAPYPGPWPWKTKLLTNTANVKRNVASFYDETLDGIIVTRGSYYEPPTTYISERWMFIYMDMAGVTSPIVDGTSDKITAYSPTFSGVTLPLLNDANNDQQAGVAYVPELRKLFIYHHRPAESMFMYEIQLPANPKTQAWVVSRTNITNYSGAGGNLMNLPTNQPGGPGNPMHKRMHYCKELKGLVMVLNGAANATSQTLPVFFYRIPGL